MYDKVYQRNAKYSRMTKTAHLLFEQTSPREITFNGTALTDTKGSIAEHEGCDKDHNDHAQENDCRDDADGLEHLGVITQRKG
jgi:hypothetical protein